LPEPEVVPFARPLTLDGLARRAADRPHDDRLQAIVPRAHTLHRVVVADAAAQTPAAEEPRPRSGGADSGRPGASQHNGRQRPGSRSHSALRCPTGRPSSPAGWPEPRAPWRARRSSRRSGCGPRARRRRRRSGPAPPQTPSPPGTARVPPALRGRLPRTFAGRLGLLRAWTSPAPRSGAVDEGSTD